MSEKTKGGTKKRNLCCWCCRTRENDKRKKKGRKSSCCRCGKEQANSSLCCWCCKKEESDKESYGKATTIDSAQVASPSEPMVQSSVGSSPKTKTDVKEPVQEHTSVEIEEPKLKSSNPASHSSAAKKDTVKKEKPKIKKSASAESSDPQPWPATSDLETNEDETDAAEIAENTAEEYPKVLINKTEDDEAEEKSREENTENTNKENNAYDEDDNKNANKEEVKATNSGVMTNMIQKIRKGSKIFSNNK